MLLVAAVESVLGTDAVRTERKRHVDKHERSTYVRR